MLLGAGNALNLLVRLYGDTDKLSHGYLPHYETHVGPRRFDSMLVFEIGVGGYESLTPGGSLAVWRDYFFRSRIVGLDIEDKLVRLGSRVAFERADQNSHEDLRAVVARHGVPDIVIDDGSHVGAHIRATFEFLWPQMRAGSIYVIEDLSTSYYPSYDGGDPPPPSSAIALLQSMVDSVQAQDNTFDRYPEWGTRSAPAHADLQALHVYPGIAFIVKG
ncbi:O-methyltransferase I [Janibacter sp. HTCC2649]|nr:O-methyltransferase I [Janibacter sp. HTCC2649]